MANERAHAPNDLERLFVERVNARDLDGLLALYESDAVVAVPGTEILTGHAQIRKFLADMLATEPNLDVSVQSGALVSGSLALTSSRHSNGDVSAEIARQQPDGTWRWVVDSFALEREE